MVQLSAADVAELETALEQQYAALASPWRASGGRFLPVLQAPPRGARARAARRSGALLLHGLPADRHDLPTSPRSTRESAPTSAAPLAERAGHLLGHVRDMGYDADDPNVRIYQTNAGRTTTPTPSTSWACSACTGEAPAGSRASLARSRSTTSCARAAGSRRRSSSPSTSTDAARCRRAEAVVRDPRLQLARRAADHHLCPRLHRVGPALPRRPPPHRAAARGARPVRRASSRIPPSILHGLRARRHPARSQPSVLHDRTEYEDWPEPARKRHLLDSGFSARRPAAAGRFRGPLRRSGDRRPRGHRPARRTADRPARTCVADALTHRRLLHLQLLCLRNVCPVPR